MAFGFGRKKQDEIEITISNRTVFRVVLLITVSFLFLMALRAAAHALTLLFTALFLALALNAPVHWIAQRLPGKRRGNRTVATGISFLIVIGALIGFLASIVPPLVSQTSDFINNVPGLIQDLRNDDSALGRFVQDNNLEGQIDKLSAQFSDKIGSIGGSALGTAGKITGSLFSVLSVLVLTFMMLVEGPRWLKTGQRLVAPDRRKHIKTLLRDMYAVIKGYVNGQVILAALAALFIVVPLVILKVSYPVALMVIVFVCGLIPMVGHTIGAVIVSTVALFQSPITALIILAYYFLYQQIENYIIQPRIQANSTNMSPLLVFSSVLIGVSFGGLLGGLVAIPVAGCLRILLIDYLESRRILHPVTSEQAVPEVTPKATS